MTKVPMKLAKYLVQRFNVQNTSMRLEQETINIDKEDVSIVLGIFLMGLK